MIDNDLLHTNTRIKNMYTYEYTTIIKIHKTKIFMVPNRIIDFSRALYIYCILIRFSGLLMCQTPFDDKDVVNFLYVCPFHFSRKKNQKTNMKFFVF